MKTALNYWMQLYDGYGYDYRYIESMQKIFNQYFVMVIKNITHIHYKHLFSKFPG